jgi:3-hydroxyacyl-CoA dehydrogenase
MMILSQVLRHSSQSVLRRGRQQQRLLSTTSFDKVGVIGLGLMGHGIAQVAATCGVHSSIVAFEPEEKYLLSGRARIEASIAKLVQKGKMSQADADQSLARITFTTDMNDLAHSDFIVEAVIENIQLKEELYTALGKTCQPATIFASNTSSLSISEMAQFSGRPANFVGVHFFNPVQIVSTDTALENE